MDDIVWHGHHSTRCPLERLTGTLAKRQANICANKSAQEQETRLRLLRPASEEAHRLFRDYSAVCDQTQCVYEAAHISAWRDYVAACDSASAATRSSGAQARRRVYEAARDSAWRDYLAACDSALQPILALHATECFPNCEWNGQEIVFPQ